MANKHTGICPYCADNVVPILVEENTARRDICKCPSCKKGVLICRTHGCQDYAKAGSIYDDELCPGCTSSLISGTGEVFKWVAISAAGLVVAAIGSGKKK